MQRLHKWKSKRNKWLIDDLNLTNKSSNNLSNQLLFMVEFYCNKINRLIRGTRYPVQKFKTNKELCRLIWIERDHMKNGRNNKQNKQHNGQFTIQNIQYQIEHTFQIKLRPIILWNWHRHMSMAKTFGFWIEQSIDLVVYSIYPFVQLHSCQCLLLAIVMHCMSSRWTSIRTFLFHWFSFIDEKRVVLRIYSYFSNVIIIIMAEDWRKCEM